MRYFWPKALKKSGGVPERGLGQGNYGGTLHFRKHLMSLTVSAILLGLVMVPFTNCAPEHGVAPLSSSGPNLQQVLAAIQSQKNSLFVAKCATCHNTSATDPAIVTRDLFDTIALVGDGVIELGSPQTSDLYIYLVDEIHSSTLNVSVTGDELNVVRDWIAAEGGNFDILIGGAPIGGGGSAPIAVTFQDVRTILNASCVGCHNNNLANGAPDLSGTAAQLRARTVTVNGLVNAPLIVPGSPSVSRLFLALATMPKGGPFGLNSSQATIIRTWIQGGAN